MPADLIIYGVIAAGLVFWLRSILGTRHGDERERPNPLTPAAPVQQGLEDMAALNGRQDVRPVSASSRISEIAANPKGVFSIDNKNAEEGLLDVARAEKGFDIDFFAAACQDVFVMVVEAFAKGDRDALQDLLAKDVYQAFEAAISERDVSGETLESEIHAIKKAQVVSATISGKRAFITVRFVADETRILRSKENQIISGHPERVSEMIDIWTFSHELGGRDPRWLLVETRSDDASDNDIVPDTKV